MSVAAKIKNMAAKILEDVLNNFISIDSLLEWLSMQSTVNDVNIFINHYKCSQVEFASYFLNFLREQSSMILQSSCTAETPCKSSQLRKMKILNFSSEKTPDALKSDDNSSVKEKNLDLKSFPTLEDGSLKTRNNYRNCSKFGEDSSRDCLSVSSESKDSSKKCRRAMLFPESFEKNSTSPEEDLSLSHIKFFELRNHPNISTPKSSEKEMADLTEYFNDFKNLDGSPEWSPSLRWKKDFRKKSDFTMDKNLQNSSSNSSINKSKMLNEDSSSSKSKDFKSGSRMMLGDFIVNDLNVCETKKDKKNKIKKRINPTPVNSETHKYEGNSFEISSSTTENGTSIGEDREMLKTECATLLEQLEAKSQLGIVKKDPLMTRMISTSSKTAMPNLESATFVHELKMLSRIYSFILDENYCQNVMIEFCFMISLLVMQDHTLTDLDKKLNKFSEKGSRKFLATIHNCVYFAVETLWLQRNILLLLNLAALKLLSENKQVEKFNVKLKKFLEKACIEREEKEILRRHVCDSKGIEKGNVSYEYEIDNRDNFTNDFSFHSFRKQRDLFYNILAIWEENHLESDWVFSNKLDSKIRSLLSISNDPSNLLHLARLFRNQLVTSCCGEYQIDDESNEEILQLLASVDPNKILRLRARLSSLPKRQGPCPLPDFTGYQEFFKGFITSTIHTVFHYYLKNSLCDEILRLNDAEFNSELEDDYSCLDQQTQTRYLQQMKVLCLLAKFLGFIEFLPYRSDKPLPNRVLSVHCAVRQNLLPLFDIQLCLKNAFTKHKLTVTIPWIVSYLSMIDFCSARLKVYEEIWRILIIVYRQLKICKNLMNSFYLKLSLGWMFQLPNFPADLFYTVLEDMNKNSSLDLCIEFSVGLDSYNFIEENILYSICPFLNEINAILLENSACNVKHIRPVKAQGNETTASQLTKQMELRLEENFLHNQSSSTRKTMEFVTERVSSVAVKYLISEVLPKIKEEALKEIYEICEDREKELEEEIEIVSDKYYKNLISTCEIESWHICSLRSEKALSALLSADLVSAVSEICTQIVIRQSAEKVKRWIQAYITPALIKNEFTAIALKRIKVLANPSNISQENPSSSFSVGCNRDEIISKLGRKGVNNIEGTMEFVSNAAISLREITWKIYEEGKIVWEEINNVMEIASKSLMHNQNISQEAKNTLIRMIIDLIVMVCLRISGDIKKCNLFEFFNFLKKFSYVHCCDSLERIICPRNVALFLNEGKGKKKPWENLGNIFLFLMEEELLTQEQVETQLVSLLRQNWEKKEGALYGSLFSHILSGYTSKNGCDKFTLLLECLIETLNDNESDDLKL